MTMCLLTQSVREHKADILLISEQPRSPADDDWRRSSQDAGAQIILRDTARLAVAGSFCGCCYVGINTGDLVFVSCYLPSSLGMGRYARVLDKIGEECQRFPHAGLVIGGDFNARVEAWGSNKTDAKGELLLEFAAGIGLYCEKGGSVPTFQSGRGESVIDFTLSRLTGGRVIE